MDCTFCPCPRGSFNNYSGDVVLCTDYYIYFIVRLGNKFKSDVEFLGVSLRGQRGIMRSDRYVVNDSNCEAALLLLFYRPIAQRNSVFSYSHFLTKPSVFCVLL